MKLEEATEKLSLMSQWELEPWHTALRLGIEATQRYDELRKLYVIDELLPSEDVA